ncbi:hypothetical protein [Flavivirga spongiicola]|uniref:Uncharacterized protein n=1 Tax=Flavivirga spongiicola TaxID=421621 RepID=A0ABU7XX62_9FLAO|nr:hypothetical protein [Flavivirga sp. MEBiC05379]MDO5980378.1 hypothetical protein [Flavivirga sp. MEBiC05379]
MKRTLFIVFVFTTLIGCKDNKPNEIKVDLVDNEIINDTLSKKVTNNLADTLSAKQQSSITFDTDFSDWKTDEVDLSQFEFLERTNDTLKIIARDTTIRLVNEYFDDEKQNYGASRFIVANVYPNHDVIELQAISYEYSYHVLAYLKTGDTIFSYGKPMFSKDGKYIFTSNVDLNAGFDDNGYQIIKLDSLGFKNVKTVDIENWGIQKASWIGTDSIVYSKVTLNENYGFDTEVKKIKIK